MISRKIHSPQLIQKLLVIRSTVNVNTDYVLFNIRNDDSPRNIAMETLAKVSR